MRKHTVFKGQQGCLVFYKPHLSNVPTRHLLGNNSFSRLSVWLVSRRGGTGGSPIHQTVSSSRKVCMRLCVTCVCSWCLFVFCLLLWQITWPVDLSQVCVYVSFNSIRKGFLNPKGKFSLNNSDVENNHRLQIAVLLKDTVARQKLGMLTNNQSSIN